MCCCYGLAASECHAQIQRSSYSIRDVHLDVDTSRLQGYVCSITAVDCHHDLPNSHWSLASMLIRVMSAVIKPSPTQHVLDQLVKVVISRNCMPAFASRQNRRDNPSRSEDLEAAADQAMAQARGTLGESQPLPTVDEHHMFIVDVQQGVGLAASTPDFPEEPEPSQTTDVPAGRRKSSRSRVYSGSPGKLDPVRGFMVPSGVSNSESRPHIACCRSYCYASLHSSMPLLSRRSSAS